MTSPSSLGCVATAQSAFDMRNANDCLSTLQSLLQAYTNLVSGNHRVTVRFGERWSEYNKGNVNGLLTLYQTLYTACPHAASAGLPSLQAGSRVKRGRPVSGFNAFPRL